MASEADNKRPWVIRLLRVLVSLRIARQLSDDEYMLLTVVGEWQDRRVNNLGVNISLRQLCLRMCISFSSPRRIINATKSLAERGLMTCTKPELGSQMANLYWINLAALVALNDQHKTELDESAEPSVMATDDQATICHGDRGGSVTATEGYCHGDRPFTPDVFTPDIITPDIPLNPPKGGETETDDEVFSLKGNKPKAARAAKSDHASVTAQSEAIYQAYPLKAGKQNALRAIGKALKVVPFERLLERVTAYSSAVAKWPAPDRQFVPYPASWMNAGSWEDDPATWERHSTGRNTTLAGNAGQVYDQEARAKDPHYGKL